MKKTYSTTIANAIDEVLSEYGWEFSFNHEKGLFKFGLTIDSRVSRVQYVVDVKDTGFIVYSIFPITVEPTDDGMMNRMAEFICRANNGLQMGNFEFGMDDGVIKFKDYVDCDGIIPTVNLIKNSLTICGLMFEHYGEGILGILFENKSARDAIECSKRIAEAQIRALFAGLTDNSEEDNEGEPDGMLDRLAEAILRDNGEYADDESVSMDEEG